MAFPEGEITVGTHLTAVRWALGHLKQLDVTLVET